MLWGLFPSSELLRSRFLSGGLRGFFRSLYICILPCGFVSLLFFILLAFSFICISAKQTSILFLTCSSCIISLSNDKNTEFQSYANTFITLLSYVYLNSHTKQGYIYTYIYLYVCIPFDLQVDAVGIVQVEMSRFWFLNFSFLLISNSSQSLCRHTAFSKGDF